MPKIRIELNDASIDHAIRQVRDYQRRVEAMAGALTHELTEQGVSLAQLNAAYMDLYDTGELVRGIESRYRGKVGVVASTSPHSIFCEFGTGVVGAGKPHPEVAAAGWRYDVNGHGELGWWYPGRDGRYHWTKGMPSRPYLYEAAQMLRRMVVPMAKEAIK